MNKGICFISSTRYSWPLDTTREKKFGLLVSLGPIEVVGFSERLRPRMFTEHAHFYLLPKLPVAALRYAEMFVLAPILTLWAVFRHRATVLVAQSPYEGFAAAWAKIVAGWLGRRTVLVIESHNDFEESVFLQRRVTGAGAYRYLMRATARFAFKYADLLRAVSDSTEQQLRRWAPDKPVIRFTTWTDLDAFLQATKETSKPRSQNILFAGVLVPGKGVHHLIEAFSDISTEYPHVDLVIVGAEENASYASNLRSMATDAGLERRVQFVTAVPQAELAQLMLRAAVFVLPSLSEGLPRVVAEAMATNTPVISTRVGGIPDIIEDKRNGLLISPGDVPALAERLRWVLDHPLEAEEMGRRGRRVASELFSAEAYMRGYTKILEAAETSLADA